VKTKQHKNLGDMNIGSFLNTKYFKVRSSYQKGHHMF